MGKKYYIIPIFVSHQGCPHQCVFCNQSRIAKVVEDVTADDVIETVEEYLKTIDYKNATVEISFFGGTFTAINVEKQKELLQVAATYKNKGLIDKIRLSTRPDAINNYILNYLKEYKVDIIELGVQSLSNEVLIKAGRGHTSEDVVIASSLIKKSGFTLGHQIMPGLPGDTFEVDINTALKSIEMKPDIVRIYPALVIKDTPMEEMFNRGDYVPYSLEEAIEVSKEIYKLYSKAKIQVIRMGLQATENINSGKDIVDGPFHPAFSELVQSALMWESIEKEVNVGENIIIEINPKDVSKLFANKKANYIKFMKNYLGEVEVKQNPKQKPSSVRITFVSKVKNIKL